MTTPACELTLWQLIDSAFPIGGFAHSNGLEACWQQGLVTDAASLASFIRSALEQATAGSLYFVTAAWRGEEPFAALDAYCDATLSNHVANKASRAQGRALLVAAGGTFDRAAIREVEVAVRGGKAAGHFGPVFGVVAASLRMDEGTVGRAFLFLILRGMVSAAVRLGIVGPMEGQRLQHESGHAIATLIGQPRGEPVQTSPVLDLLQANQGRLYSRLFQS